MAKNSYLDEFTDKLNLQLGAASNLAPSDWIHRFTNIENRGIITPFSFGVYKFQKQIVDDPSRQLCVKKCCQIGATEIFVRLALEMVANRGFTTILTQPNFEASRNFSKTRIQPVIEKSEKLLNLVKETNSVNLKRIGSTFLHIKYTKGAEQHALSTPADVRISDEIDQSDQSNLRLFQSRLEASRVRITRDFGTPTIPKYGITVLYDKSYQFKYMIKCPHCGEWNEPGINNLINFPLDLFQENLPDFPVVYKDELADLEDKVFIGCTKCGKSLEYHKMLLLPESSTNPSPIAPKHQWVNVTNELSRADQMVGYHISQIGTGFKTGKMIIQSMRAYERTRDIYNQLLGEAFIPSQDSLMAQDIIFDNISMTPPFCVMGVDFGRKTYATLYYYDSIEKKGFMTRIFEVPLFTSSNDDFVIDEILRIGTEMGAAIVVVDALPYQNAVNKLKNLASVPVFDCYLTDKEQAVFKMDLNKMTIRGGRTSAIDAMISDFKSARDVITGDCAQQKALILEHLTNFSKIDRGDGQYFYPKMGPDHIGFAHMYAKKAAFALAEHYPEIMSAGAFGVSGINLPFSSVEMVGYKK